MTIESERRVWSGLFPLDIVTFRNRRFDGGLSKPHVWELWRRGRAVALIPYDPWSDSVVLVEQFRLPALAAGMDPLLSEVPAGLVEENEAPEIAILREMREETRLDADRLEPIGRFLLSPGGTDETCALFAGRVHAPAAGPDGIAGLAGAAGEQEDIRVRVRPAAAAIETAFAGGFPNVITTLALLWLAAKRDELRQRWLAE